MRSLLLVVVALAVFASLVHAEEDPATLEVRAGYGTSSTSWDIPSTGTSAQHVELNGGEMLSVRALLTVPVSPRFAVLLGYHRASVDRGWLDPLRQTFFASDQLGMAEVGFRLKL